MFALAGGRIRKLDARGGRKNNSARPAPGSERRCACCGERENVAPHPKMELVLICSDCLESSLLPVELFELGVGD